MKKQATEKARRKKGQRLGWLGYLDILRHIQLSPSTSDQVAAVFNIAALNGPKVMRHLHAAKLAHISDWTKEDAPRANWRPVWSAGHRPDAARPGEGTRSWARSNNIAPQLIALASAIRCLAEPITREDLVAATGCGDGTVRQMLKHAKRIGFVRVSDWIPPSSAGGPPTAMWCLGSRPDAPKPAAKSRTEIYAENWRRRKGRKAMQALIHATAANRPCFLEAATA